MPKPIVFAHYMPWFAGSPTWRHWRGERNPGKFNPEDTDTCGRRKIASRYYPLCGPYDSTNPDVIDRHLRLMKESGIDGIIVDWYGEGLNANGDRQYNDYNDIHNATTKIWDIVKVHPTDLAFVLMFDGHHAIETVDQYRAKKWTTESSEDYVQRALECAAKHFFPHHRYFKHSDTAAPLLLVFGYPEQYPVVSVNWCKLMSHLESKPFVLSQDIYAKTWANGVFFWPNPEKGLEASSECSLAEAIKHVCSPDEWKCKELVVMGVAFPGYNDIYWADKQESKHKASVDRGQGGETYRKTLKKACQERYVQIVTWNDWGEGTQIEPSIKFGDVHLKISREYIAKFKSGEGDDAVG